MLPLCPFPSVAWLVHASKLSTVHVDVHEHYVKQTYRNRFDILGVNGRLSLTLPVEGQKGQKVMMKDIALAPGNWNKLHMTSIKSAYGRAAFFEYYIDEVEAIFNEPPATLVEFNLATVNFVTRHIPLPALQFSNEHTPYVQLSEEQKKLSQSLEPSYHRAPYPSYPQVFSDRFAFQSNLSALDLLMNMGPRSVDYLLLAKNGE
jgi:hypothetical protein